MSIRDLYWKKEWENRCQFEVETVDGIVTVTCGCDYPPSNILDLIERSNWSDLDHLDVLRSKDDDWYSTWLWFLFKGEYINPEDCGV